MRGPHGRQSASRRCSCRATFAARRESGRSPTSGSEPYGIASGPDGALYAREITRPQFEQLIAPIIARTAAPVKQALRDAGFTGIEVAPTRVWPGWEGAVPAAAARLRTMFSGEGFTVPAIQAILFGAGDVALFGDHGQRARLRDHLLRAADLAAALGAGVMVFGAPSARRRGSLPPAEAMAAAADFLAAAGRDISSR